MLVVWFTRMVFSLGREGVVKRYCLLILGELSGKFSYK